MNKLKHHFLGGLVFLGTITFGYIGYSSYTSLSTQNDGAVITKDIWNNVITTINDIGNRTDGIYNNGGNITIGNGLNNPISKINIYDKDNAGDNISIYKTTTSPNLDIYSTYDGSDDLQSGSIRYGVRPSDDSWQIWDKKSGSNWNNLVSVNSNGNVGIGTTTPQTKLDVNGLFKVNTNDNTITTSKDIKEFSGKITGPDNRPTCSAPNKIVTLGTIPSDSNRAFIDVELYGTHRGYNNVDYYEYKKWVIMVGDKVSSNLISSSGRNLVSLAYNNNAAAGQNIQLSVSPSCGSGFYYTYVVRYRSDMTFIPSSQRDW